MKDVSLPMLIVCSLNVVLMTIVSIVTRSFHINDYLLSAIIMIYALRDYLASKKK